LKREKNGEQPGFAFLTVLVFILGSCASLAGEKRPYAYLTDNARYVLLPPGGIEKAMDSSQFISASYRDGEYYFYAWVRADETGMDMTMFNELGASMGDLSYRDGAVNLSSRVFPNSMKPEYIVADFQLCFYNPVLLRRALEKCGLVLEMQGNTRRVLSGRKLITEIEKAHNAVRLVNHLRGYAYTLEGNF